MIQIGHILRQLLEKQIKELKLKFTLFTGYKFKNLYGNRLKMYVQKEKI